MRSTAVGIVIAALVGVGALGLSVFLSDRDGASVAQDEGPGVAVAEEAGLGEAGAVDVPGNVVIVYSQDGDAAALRALANEIAGANVPELEAAGQAVLVRQDPAADGIVAVTAEKAQRVVDPADPRLRAFVEAWLGRSPG